MVNLPCMVNFRSLVAVWTDPIGTPGYVGKCVKHFCRLSSEKIKFHVMCLILFFSISTHTHVQHWLHSMNFFGLIYHWYARYIIKRKSVGTFVPGFTVWWIFSVWLDWEHILFRTLLVIFSTSVHQLKGRNSSVLWYLCVYLFKSVTHKAHWSNIYKQLVVSLRLSHHQALFRTIIQTL